MRVQITVIFLILFLTGNASVAQTQSVTGTWATYDDTSGKKRSHVTIYEKNGKLYGKIIKLFPQQGEDPDPVCDECDEDDPRFGKKVIGMEIIKNLRKDGNEYSGGTVLDPENGEVYKCKLWLEDGNLILRGYIGFSLLGRSQTWKRVN